MDDETDDRKAVIRCVYAREASTGIPVAEGPADLPPELRRESTKKENGLLGWTAMEKLPNVQE